MDAYRFYDDVAAAIAIPESGMAKAPLVQAAGARVLGFGFAAGHELKEHTAPADVLLHFVEGEGEITLGSDRKQVRAGSVVHIPARMPHSVRAVTPVKMVLVLLQS